MWTANKPLTSVKAKTACVVVTGAYVWSAGTVKGAPRERQDLRLQPVNCVVSRWSVFFTPPVGGCSIVAVGNHMPGGCEQLEQQIQAWLEIFHLMSLWPLFQHAVCICGTVNLTDHCEWNYSRQTCNRENKMSSNNTHWPPLVSLKCFYIHTYYSTVWICSRVRSATTLNWMCSSRKWGNYTVQQISHRKTTHTPNTHHLQNISREQRCVH